MECINKPEIPCDDCRMNRLCKYRDVIIEVFQNLESIGRAVESKGDNVPRLPEFCNLYLKCEHQEPYDITLYKGGGCK